MSKLTGARLSRLKQIPQTYKGFSIGYFEDAPGGRYQVTAAYCWPKALNPEMPWEEIHVLADGVEDVYRLAVECIDYKLITSSMERLLGRKLEWHELPKTIKG